MIANGEIWNVADYQRCKQMSQSDDFMLGRGLLSCPDLALQIKSAAAGESYEPMSWKQVCEMLIIFFDTTTGLYAPKHIGNRVKQWLNYLRRQYPEAQLLFEEVKRLKTKPEIDALLNRYLDISIDLNSATGIATGYAQPA